MRITNKIGTIIDSFDSWKNAFVEIDSEKHWREGRSACALASHFTSTNIEDSDGIKELKECLNAFGLQNVVFTHGEIEHESRFDKYRGKGRMQDLIIWGHSEQPLVICIEAKVDETFGNTIEDAHKETEYVLSKKPKSNAKKRIENLCDEFYANSPTSSTCKSKRYQLLYYLAGSMKEAIKIKGNLFLPVIVYHTDDFNEEIGKDNCKDYVKFMDSVGFTRCDNEGRILFKKEIDGIKIFSAYIEIK